MLLGVQRGTCASPKERAWVVVAWLVLNADERLDPRFEVRRKQVGKSQQQVPKIALRIDADGGNAVEGGFFQERETQARLSTARFEVSVMFVERAELAVGMSHLLAMDLGLALRFGD